MFYISRKNKSTNNDQMRNPNMSFQNPERVDQIRRGGNPRYSGYLMASEKNLGFL